MKPSGPSRTAVAPGHRARVSRSRRYWPVQASKTWTVEFQPLTKRREPQDWAAVAAVEAARRQASSKWRGIGRFPEWEWPDRRVGALRSPENRLRFVSDLPPGRPTPGIAP